jgi:hypothetical protein
MNRFMQLATTFATLLWAAIAVGPAWGQGSQAWRSAEAVQQRLQTKGRAMPAAGLRGAIRTLSFNEGIAMLLDRRIDSQQQVEALSRDSTLEECLEQMVEGRNVDYSVFGPVIYFGPPQAAARLRTVAHLRREEAASLPAAVAQRLQEMDRLKWGDFATPRELLTQLAAAAGFELRGLEQVPHDLWAFGDLPALSLIDRLSLVAIQFDLTFRVEGGAIVLVPIPEDVAIARAYPGGSDPEALAQKWAALIPESEVRAEGAKVVVRGPIEDHERIASPQPQSPPRAKTASQTAGARKVTKKETTYTVNSAKGPMGRLLTELTGKLGLELRIDEKALEQAGISLNQEVSFQVKDAKVEELLRAVVAPAGCDVRLRGKVVEVFPAK